MARATPPQSHDPEAVVRFRGRALSGATESRAAVFDPNAPLTRAPTPPVKQRRPALTRFPISIDEYQALKERARSAKHRRVRAVTVALDTAGAVAPGARAAAAAAPTTPPNIVNAYSGLAATQLIPPDCTIGAGPQHLVVAVNSMIAIYDKTNGTALLQRELSTWFGNVAQIAPFDPRIVYDQFDDRWILLAVGVDAATKVSVFLLSVSQSSSALGPWSNYAIDATVDGAAATNNWADYPAIGVDHQALYLSANMFQFGGNYAYAKLRIVPKATVYAGGAVSYTDLTKMANTDGSMVFTLQPCHTFGAPQEQYFVNSIAATPAAAAPSEIAVWTLTTSAGAFTLTRRAVACSPYSTPPLAVQQGGAVGVDTGDVRMLTAVCRGGSVWCALTTGQNFGDDTNVAAAHWFQLNPTSGNIIQQGIFGAQGRHYFYPSLAVDTDGNMILAFSRSSPVEFPSLYVTGRRASDPLGTLRTSALVKAGIASYVALDGNGLNRWGDYCGAAADPIDSRLWFHGEASAAGNQWLTAIGSATVP